MQQKGRDRGPLRRLHIRPHGLGRAGGGPLAHDLAAAPVPPATTRRHCRHEEGDAGAYEQRQEAVAVMGGVAVRARRRLAATTAGRASLTGSL